MAEKMTNKTVGRPGTNNKSNMVRSFLFTFLLICFGVILLANLSQGTVSKTEVPISEVIQRANDPDGNIKKITVTGNDLEITLKDKDQPTEVSRKDGSGTLYDQGLVNYCEGKEAEVLDECLKNYPIIEYKEAVDVTGIIFEVLMTVLPIVAIVIFLSWMVKQANAANNQSIGFGKSRAKLYGPDKKKVMFKDVAGNESAKQDLTEIVDFLKNPKKYEKLGAKSPRGVLLAGDPGTGKTLMARAVAGEANVPFFSISGSEFAEMFVGVGASRVRDLFSRAKKNAPSIIFIDEIDAVAHKRDARGGAGREDEQTLNQILVEMDGFDNDSGVIVTAATNRVDMLDKALLRPGRFDRHVNVTLPERKDRLEILKVHFKG